VVAGRIAGTVRAGDVVARLGGDEFAVIMPWTDEDTAATVADRIVRKLAEPLQVAGRTVLIGASIGLISAMQGDDPDAQLRRADSAMYVAKAQGRGRVHAAHHVEERR
jgi:diguanylate cyclase (GGDEF)-like protein